MFLHVFLVPKSRIIQVHPKPSGRISANVKTSERRTPLAKCLKDLKDLKTNVSHHVTSRHITSHVKGGHIVVTMWPHVLLELHDFHVRFMSCRIRWIHLVECTLTKDKSMTIVVDICETDSILSLAAGLESGIFGTMAVPKLRIADMRPWSRFSLHNCEKSATTPLPKTRSLPQLKMCWTAVQQFLLVSSCQHWSALISIDQHCHAILPSRIGPFSSVSASFPCFFAEFCPRLTMRSHLSQLFPWNWAGKVCREDHRPGQAGQAASAASAHWVPDLRSCWEWMVHGMLHSDTQCMYSMHMPCICQEICQEIGHEQSPGWARLVRCDCHRHQRIASSSGDDQFAFPADGKIHSI